MTDLAETQAPRAHARIVYHGPVAPHWEVYGDWGDRQVLDEFRARVLARLVLLPRDDPQTVSASCATPSANASPSSGISATPRTTPDRPAEPERTDRETE